MLAIGLLPAAVRAQTLTLPAPRQGYYLGISAQGVASSSVDEDLGRLRLAGGPGVSLRIGEMINRWLGVGFQVDYGRSASHRWEQQFGGLLLDGQWLVWKHLAIHLGAGVGFVQAEDKKGRVEGTLGVGGAYYSAGLAYDFFPAYQRGSGGLGITPMVQVKHLPGDSFNSTFVWVGLEGVWWMGLDRQELELPVEEAFVRPE
jgi:hypothetical protein